MKQMLCVFVSYRWMLMIVMTHQSTGLSMDCGMIKEWFYFSLKRKNQILYQDVQWFGFVGWGFFVWGFLCGFYFWGFFWVGFCGVFFGDLNLSVLMIEKTLQFDMKLKFTSISHDLLKSSGHINILFIHLLLRSEIVSSTKGTIVSLLFFCLSE